MAVRSPIAVLADVHGNLPALRAVLAEVDAEGVDVIVVAGDVVGGPQPREVLDLLAARPERVLWVAGNAEREAVRVWDGASPAEGPPGRAARWSADRLDRRRRDALASWPIRVSVGGVCVCHGSPRRDDEILTRATPDDALRDALTGVAEPVVAGGHTHQQVHRAPADAPAYVNAGSVGMPYEGRPGAFWLLLRDGVPEHRRTDLDVDEVAAELRATGYPDVEDMLRESLLDPVDADRVTALFERASGRGAS
jgi:putative phosphoesterase